MKVLDASSASAQAAALSPSSYHDFAGLAALKGKAGRAGEGDKALRAAAQQFEAMFLQEMMRTMRQATIKSDLLESSAMETYEGMFDKEVAMQMAKRGGMGLSEMMVKQMQRHVDGQAQMQKHLEQQAQPEEPASTGAAEAAGSVTAQDALATRRAAGLPLQRPAQAHEIRPVETPQSLPLRARQGYDLPRKGPMNLE